MERAGESDIALVLKPESKVGIRVLGNILGPFLRESKGDVLKADLVYSVQDVVSDRDLGDLGLGQGPRGAGNVGSGHLGLIEVLVKVADFNIRVDVDCPLQRILKINHQSLVQALDPNVTENGTDKGDADLLVGRTPCSASVRILHLGGDLKGADSVDVPISLKP